MGAKPLPLVEPEIFISAGERGWEEFLLEGLRGVDFLLSVALLLGFLVRRCSLTLCFWGMGWLLWFGGWKSSGMYTRCVPGGSGCWLKAGESLDVAHSSCFGFGMVKRSSTSQTVRHVALATAAFCLVHSALASRPAKRFVERLVGTRRRNGFYRPVYNVVALASAAGLVKVFFDEPKRTVYQIRGSAAVLCRTGQVAALAYAAAAAWEVGPLELSGVRSLVALMMGRRVVPREAEAQSVFPVEDGGIHPVGPFRVSRHPLNLAPIPLLWLQPHMTSRFAAFAAVATLYFYLGSVHSDRRLEARYGGAYRRYRRGTPRLLLPLP